MSSFIERPAIREIQKLSELSEPRRAADIRGFLIDYEKKKKETQTAKSKLNETIAFLKTMSKKLKTEEKTWEMPETDIAHYRQKGFAPNYGKKRWLAKKRKEFIDAHFVTEKEKEGTRLLTKVGLDEVHEWDLEKAIEDWVSEQLWYIKEEEQDVSKMDEEIDSLAKKTRDLQKQKEVEATSAAAAAAGAGKKRKRRRRKKRTKKRRKKRKTKKRRKKRTKRRR